MDTHDASGRNGKGALPPEGKKVMHKESPDGMPPGEKPRSLGRAVFFVAITAALVGAVMVLASVATGVNGLLIAGVVVLLVGVLGGMPAIMAGVLRRQAADQAVRGAAKPAPPRDIV